MLFHATARANRASIEERGLIARDTTKWNYPAITENGGVEAVYAACDPDFWQWAVSSEQSARVDIWAIEEDGLPTDDDQCLGYPAVRILCDVPPERIELWQDKANVIGVDDSRW